MVLFTGLWKISRHYDNGTNSHSNSSYENSNGNHNNENAELLERFSPSPRSRSKGGYLKTVLAGETCAARDPGDGSVLCILLTAFSEVFYYIIDDTRF